MRHAHNRNPWSRFTAGILLLTAGTIFWLDRIGRIEGRDFLEWWPLALVVTGIGCLPQRRWGAAAAWILLGLFFLAPTLGYAEWNVWGVIGLWPLLISVAGVTLLVQALRPGVSGPSNFHALAVMGGNVRSVGSQDFTSGEAVAVMGGCEIDLSAAKPRGGEAVLEVLAFWGGIGIRVPTGWRVENRVAAILGGYEDRTTTPSDPNAPRLIIRGSAIMGGVEVRNSGERMS